MWLTLSRESTSHVRITGWPPTRRARRWRGRGERVCNKEQDDKEVISPQFAEHNNPHSCSPRMKFLPGQAAASKGGQQPRQGARNAWWECCSNMDCMECAENVRHVRRMSRGGSASRCKRTASGTYRRRVSLKLAASSMGDEWRGLSSARARPAETKS